MKMLIDGDVIAYRCGFAGEKTKYDYYRPEDVEEREGPDGEKLYDLSGDPVHTADNAKEGKEWVKMQVEDGDESAEALVRLPRKEIEPVGHVLHSVKRVMEAIKERMGPGEMHVYFSCPTPDNWRTTFYPEYKANRPDRKPFWSDEIKAYLQDGPWNVVRDPHFEADDLIAMAAYEATEQGEDWVIVSIDKDFYQIPGKHYDWVKEELMEIDEDRARQLHAIQCLMGDNVDNIKGIPGWGEVAAWNHLQEVQEGSFDEIVLEGYRTAVDKQKKIIYETEAAAAYDCAVTRALVTLPEDRQHVEELMEVVENARKDLEEDTALMQGAGDGGGTPADDAEDAA